MQANSHSPGSGLELGQEGSLWGACLSAENRHHIHHSHTPDKQHHLPINSSLKIESTNASSTYSNSSPMTAKNSRLGRVSAQGPYPLRPTAFLLVRSNITQVSQRKLQPSKKQAQAFVSKKVTNCLTFLTHTFFLRKALPALSKQCRRSASKPEPHAFFSQTPNPA